MWQPLSHQYAFLKVYMCIELYIYIYLRREGTKASLQCGVKSRAHWNRVKNEEKRQRWTVVVEVGLWGAPALVAQGAF